MSEAVVDLGEGECMRGIVENGAGEGLGKQQEEAGREVEASAQSHDEHKALGRWSPWQPLMCKLAPPPRPPVPSRALLSPASMKNTEDGHCTTQAQILHKALQRGTNIC